MKCRKAHKLLCNHQKNSMKNSNLFLVGFFITLSSCYTGIPITAEKPANNKTYEVEYLFEHEGCKVYRFHDHGNYVYFTNCEGTVTSIGQDSTETRVINPLRVELPGGK